MNQQSPAIPANARDVSLSMARVNLLAIPVAIVPVLLLGSLFVLVNGWSAVSQAAALFRKPVLLLVVLVHTDALCTLHRAVAG